LQTTIAILAGGQSHRMGTDKAALEIGGRTLLERAAHTALAASRPTVVIGRERPDGWPLPTVTFLPDAAPGRGPLGGLHTALCHANAPVLALACDLPLLTADALNWLLMQASAQSRPHGLAVLHDGQWEPLFSVYNPACLPLIESRLAEGRLSLHGLIEAGDFGRVEAPDWVAAQLANINTPEEWARVTRQPRN
jgi:molybdopterin-guanine dinucleotide biosynthesis protein A